MYVVTVTFAIKPGKVDEFLPRMLENAQRSVEYEPGCLQFDVCRSVDQPDTIFLFEGYESEDAFHAHTQSAHFREFDRHTAPLVSAKAVNVYRKLTTSLT